MIVFVINDCIMHAYLLLKMVALAAKLYFIID